VSDGRIASADPAESFNPRKPPACPWPALSALRARGPVARFPEAGLSMIVTYDEATEAFKRPTTFLSRYNEKPDDDYSVVSTDPPEHTRLRKLVSRSFTPARVATFEPRITALAHRLVDALPPTGPVDLVTKFAVPMPIVVLAELMGVDEADSANFKRWSDEQLSQSLAASTSDLAREFKTWATDQVRWRRSAANPPDDLITSIANAEIDGERLTELEAASNVVLLVVAGNETTANALGTAIRILLTEPGVAGRLRADRALVPAFVEEVMRFDPPVFAIPRKVACPVTVAGDDLDAGDVVLLHMASANHDEAVFADPDRFDLEREIHAPHLGFGFGPHLCVGAPLARAELRIGLSTLLDRLVDLRAVADQTVDNVPFYIFRGPTSFLADYTKRA
jgi:cytochrome P450 family 109